MTVKSEYKFWVRPTEQPKEYKRGESIIFNRKVNFK